MTERFFAAVAGGDMEALLAALAPDVVLISDGGGKANAARRPITGADKVARFLVGIAEKGADGKAGCILGVHMVGPWVTEQLGQGGGVPHLVALRARFAPTTTGVPEIRVDLPPIGSYDALLSSPQANAGATA